MGDTRLRRLTSFGGAGNLSDGTQPCVWTASFPDLSEWLRVARPLLEKGFAAYLPIRGWNAGCWSGNNALNLPDNHYDYERDPVSWQLEEVARDLLASYRLGCTPVLPKVLGSPALVSSACHGTARALALSALRVPLIRGLTIEQMTHIREEETESFSRFYTALHTALSEMTDIIDSEHELRRAVARIQIGVIDAPFHTLQSRVKRLCQHTAYKLVGRTVASACALAFSFLPADIAGVASTAVGSVSLIKLYETLSGMLEQRDKIIKDDQRSYLARLSL